MPQPYKQHNFLRWYKITHTKKQYCSAIDCLKYFEAIFSVLDMDWVINYLNILTNLNNLFIDMIYIQCDNIVLVGIT